MYKRRCNGLRSRHDFARSSRDLLWSHHTGSARLMSVYMEYCVRRCAWPALRRYQARGAAPACQLLQTPRELDGPAPRRAGPARAPALARPPGRPVAPLLRAPLGARAAARPAGLAPLPAHCQRRGAPRATPKRAPLLPTRGPPLQSAQLRPARLPPLPAQPAAPAREHDGRQVPRREDGPHQDALRRRAARDRAPRQRRRAAESAGARRGAAHPAHPGAQPGGGGGADAAGARKV
jgi:hypothetical protein